MVFLDPFTRRRLQRGVEHLHQLGPRATAEFLTEVADHIGGLPAIIGTLLEYRAPTDAREVAVNRRRPLPAAADQRGARMSATRILEWRPLRRNSLLGFAKIELQSGMVISDVTILSGDRGPWALPPSKPMLGRDGVAMKDQRGKIGIRPSSSSHRRKSGTAGQPR